MLMIMKILFNKYHANGNDFILVMDKSFPEKLRNADVISRLCDRHTGIGADGLFVISSSEEYNFFLDYYNADGSWETLCANGSRCAVHFMHNRVGLDGTNMVFGAGDGFHSAKILNNGNVLMSMGRPEYKSASISLEGVDGFFIDTGARHFVCESNNLDDNYILTVGRKIRFASEFQPHGINVNFYRFANNNNVEIKTYEKGVEQIVLSCASGSAAVVFHLSQINALKSPTTTYSSGGKLIYVFDKGWESFSSEGAVEFLFNGEFDMGVF